MQYMEKMIVENGGRLIQGKAIYELQEDGFDSEIW